MAKAKSDYGHGTGRPHPVDVHVGSRVRLRRTLRGMTQTDLGDAIGLTFQQVQKYERGMNRIGASRLYKLSHVLDVPINYFFEGMPSKVAVGSVQHEFDPFARRETLSLVRAYYQIEDADVRKRVYELIGGLGADGV